MELRITVKNYQQIEKIFREAPVKMTQELSVAVKRVLDKLESSAKKEAPVNKQSGGGNLRQSITSVMTGPARGKVTAGAEYALYVHEGTRPHVIQVVRKKVLANVRTNEIFGRTVHHPGTKANPFMQRAVESSMDFINKEFEEAVARVLK